MKNNVIVFSDTMLRSKKAFNYMIDELPVGMIIMADYKNMVLETYYHQIFFYSLNASKLSFLCHRCKTIAYSFYMMNEPISGLIMPNIKRWRLVEEVVRSMHENAEEVPYEEIYNFIKEKEYEMMREIPSKQILKNQPEKIEMFKMSEEEYIKKTMPEPWVKLEKREVGNSYVEHIECSTLEDEPFVIAENELDKNTLKECFKI